MNFTSSLTVSCHYSNMRAQLSRSQASLLAVRGARGIVD